MKAFSIRQPWTYAIIHFNKRVENRDWTPRNSNRRFRGTFLLHASKSRTGQDREDYEDMIWHCGHVPGLISRRKLLAVPLFEDFERGGIVGIANVVGSIEHGNCMEGQHAWYNGGFALELANVKPLPFTACTGNLGFFNVDTTALGLDQAIADSKHRVIPENRVAA